MSNRLPPAGSGNRRTVGSMNSAGETPGGTPGIRPGGMLPEISAVGTTGSSLYPGLGTLLYSFLCVLGALWCASTAKRTNELKGVHHAK